MNYENAFKADIPFDIMYQPSRKEASRKKPVFFIHKYFARRITANFRMSLLGFISNECDDISKMFYEKSELREDITVLDPFMGGGTTILEALRFGCKVIGNDLQPLSLFVTKGLVEDIDETKVKNEVVKLNKNVGERIKKYYKTKCPCCGVYTARTATRARTFCPPLPLTAHGHCPASNTDFRPHVAALCRSGTAVRSLPDDRTDRIPINQLYLRMIFLICS